MLSTKTKKMIERFGVCSCCGERKFIANRTRVLCDACNYKRLHGGKRRAEVKRERPKRVKRKEATGEAALFRQIWADREHRCVRCGRVLPDPPKASYFSHIHSKGARPDLRLDPNNIELLCTECHQKYEFGKRD